MTAKPLRARDLAQIHIAKQQLGLDDDTYREMLFTVTRKRSASDLDAHERNQVLQHLMSRGWKPKQTTAPRERVAKAPPQVRLIYALWGLLARNGAIQDRSPSALRAWVRHWGQATPEDVGEGAPEMLPAPVRHRVAEYLIQWCLRLGIAVNAVDRQPVKPKREKSHR
jgi:phage gp16-like protein